VRVRQADVRELPFSPGEFELVIGPGVLPWLHEPVGAVGEMARDWRPAGGPSSLPDRTSFFGPRFESGV